MDLIRVQLRELATEGNFNEKGYLDENPDVAEAIRQGWLASGRSHFERTGRMEGRKITLAGREEQVADLRRKKLEMTQRNLRSDLPVRWTDGRLNYLTDELAEISGISATEKVSSNSYDDDLWHLIEETTAGIVLDCGAGRRDIYVSNVLNYEIVLYDTTDMIGVGESLPFVDNTFDGVISVAVLEHVKDPFVCAKEICRVLKPGGWLYCCVPFLQPYHGYPHHYFNMTYQGLQTIFARFIEIERHYVNRALTPIWTLSWIVKSWADGLPPEARTEFLRLTLADLAAGAERHLEASYVLSLPDEKNMELACGTILVGRKASAGR